jgi:hypothetical protein
MARKKTADYSGITPDLSNANKGTERGRCMVEASLRETGAGRSIVLDKDGRIIAGNKTFEAASDMGLPVRIVETDGSELVAVKRTDLDLSDTTGTARKLAYYDNRAGQVGLDWDVEQVLADVTAGVDLSALWRDDELDALLHKDDAPDWGAAMDGLPDEDRAPFQQMTFTLHDTQAEQVKRAMSMAGKLGDFVDSPNQNSNGNALAFICETFITEHGQG